MHLQFSLTDLVQVIELVRSMGHTADFGDAVAEANLVTRVIVADQSSRKVQGYTPAPLGLCQGSP